MSLELAPVRVAFLEPVTASGTGVHQGVTLEVGDSVLRAGEFGSPELGGPWVVQAGAWTRREDFDAGSEAGTPNMLPGSWLRALEGHNTGTYYFANPTIPTAGVSVLNWTRESYGEALTAGPGLEMDEASAQAKLPDSGVVAGTYGTDSALEVDDRGIVTHAANGYGAETYVRGLVPSVVFSSPAWYLAVGEGAAYVPAAEGVVESVGASADPVGSVAANTWVFVYANDNGLVSDFAATPPATPYAGHARHSGDPSWRYIGSYRISGSVGVPYNFTAHGDGNRLYVRYHEAPNASPFAVLTGGTATSNTTISCSAVVPPTSRLARVRVLGSGTHAFGIPGGATDLEIHAASDYTTDLELNDSQQFYYRATSGAVTVHVLGYFEVR